MALSLWIQLIIYTILAALIPYIIYRIYLHFTLKSGETPIMQRIRELSEEGEELEEMKIEEEKPEVREIDEVSALAKAISKIVFTEKELQPNEILTLRRKGFVDFYGRYYVVNQNALEHIREIVNMLKKVEEYNFTDFDWQLFKSGIKALAVVYFHRTRGPILIPISDYFNIISMLKISPNELAMMSIDKITLGEHTFVLHKVKIMEGKRPVTHMIIAEVLSEEKAKEFISSKSLEIIEIAKQKIGE